MYFKVLSILLISGIQFISDIEYSKQFDIDIIFNISANCISVVDRYERFTASVIIGKQAVVYHAFKSIFL